MLIIFQIIIPDYGQNFISLSQINLEKSQKFQTSILGAMKKKLSVFKRLKNIVEVETLEKELLGKKVEVLKFQKQKNFL